jgi:RNA polymerase sigma factor (sigma-70 family)
MLRALAKAVRPDLERIRRQFRITEQDGEDLRQETWLRFLKKKSVVDRPAAWIVHVFRNECLRFLSRWNRRIEAIEDVVLPAPDDADPLMLATIEPHLEALPRTRRRLLWKRYVVGMTPSEIAAETGQKPATVRKALYRTLHDLRDSVREPGL